MAGRPRRWDFSLYPDGPCFAAMNFHDELDLPEVRH
jgi:hypothetical protein